MPPQNDTPEPQAMTHPGQAMPQSRPTTTRERRREWFRQFGPTAILGLLWTVSPAILGGTLLVFLVPISEWFQSQGSPGWIVYVLFFVLSAGVGFLPTYGQSVLGGWTFGFAAGFPGAMVGFIGGSVIGYLISAGVSRHKIEDAIEGHPKGRAIRDALVGGRFWKTVAIVALIRIPPNSPFALTNLVLASSGAKLAPYLLGTALGMALGMAPRTGIAVFVAAQAAGNGAKNTRQIPQEQPWWVFPLTIGTVLVVLGVLGSIANRAISHITKAEGTRPTADLSGATAKSPS
jgi:uncharacterized membrane protein YdjX (TVP38/TMEM64 family)